MRAGRAVGAHDVLPRPHLGRPCPCRGRAPWRARRRRGRRRRRRRSRRRRRARVSSAGEPSAASRPPVMIATRSHSVSASSIACVVSSTVTPRSRRSRTRSHVVARACGSMPAVGSSRNTTRGRPTSAHASERRCAWPPDSRRTGVSHGVAQPDEVEHRLGRLGGLVVRREEPQQLERAQPGIQAARLGASRRSAGGAAGRRAPGRGRARAPCPASGRR